MLKRLYIKNFTLIDQLDIEFQSGFSVITGETGAGKSIILGAIGLLLGQRADTKAIKQGADRCIVEAHFDLSHYQMQPFFERNDIDYDAADCIVRRELTAAGKSRAFINDTPVALALLKELGEQLIDIHSQHQNLLLGKQDFQTEVVDIIAGNQSLLADYATHFDQLRQKRRELEEQEERIRQCRQNQDFIQFQYNELQEAHLQEGEQEELEQQHDIMAHSEDIKTALFTASTCLSAEENGIEPQLRKTLSALHSISNLMPEAAAWVERMESCHIEIKDLTQDIEQRLSDIEFDPAALEQTENRLDTLYSLQKKHHVDAVAELIALRDQYGAQLRDMEDGDSTLDSLRAEIDTLNGKCEQLAAQLTQQRKKAAGDIEQRMHERLTILGMPKLRFQISINSTALRRDGHDEISFLFSANTSSPLQPISHVASGGEIARIMLSLKAMISGAVKLPTIIFDEIDTGVSGKIAERMAEIMKEMGANDRQVISITHLPQIAALGTVHYRVSKQEDETGTVSRMQRLSDEERVSEIAQMLSGSDVSEAAIANARQLLKRP